MSDGGSDKSHVSPLAVAAGVALVLGYAHMVTYAVGVGAMVAVVYVYLCARHPMAKCTRCEGGRIWNDARTHFGWCGKCKDDKGNSRGFHVRWGRRVWDKRVTGE